jgi:hypothetical protein
MTSIILHKHPSRGQDNSSPANKRGTTVSASI